jgi:thioesterase domain-containing protein/acyl carrier protein
MRHVIFGGEAADPQSVQRVLDHGRPERLINGYGPTETTTFATALVIDRTDGPRVPIGRPIANTKAFILDGKMEPAPIGVGGELWIGGPGVAIGYLNAPDLTAEKFVETPYGHLYRTGDVARWLPDGTIDFLGRRDQQIKLRGFRIERGEVESALRSHPAVADAAAAVQRFSDGDDRLVAYFTSRNGTVPETELRQHVADRLPSYMVPAAFCSMEKLPLTATGKLDVQALPMPTMASRSSEPVAPRTELEARILSIWKRLLKQESIGVEECFFELGGHSLLALQMFLDLERETGRAVPAGTLLQEQTVAALATLLERRARAEAASMAVAIKPAGTKLPLFCVHGGDGGILFYRELANTLTDGRPVYGLEAPWLTGRPSAAESIEQIAAEYLEQVRLVQPTGPYYLAGFSFGGVVVYEMAQQLVQQGQKVELLALFDTDNPHQQPARLSLGKRLALNFQRMEGLGTMEKARLLAKRAMGLYAVNMLMRQEKKKMSTARILKSMNEQLPAELHTLGGRTAHIEAMESYVPKPYPGRMLLFAATDRREGFRYSEGLGWEALVSELVIRRVKGAHVSILQEPHVHAVAAGLNQWLDEKP